MQGLFEAVRAACPPGVWSKAVELVRVFAVTQQSSTDSEIVCRVRLADRAIPATVQLYPEDAEWDCDCPSRAPCCEHVAAAVIALRKAETEGKAMPQAMSSAANLGYRFSRFQGELKLERLIVRGDGTKVPLKVSLSSVVAGHAEALDFAPSQEDLQLDRLVTSGAVIRPDQVLTVLKLLVGHKNLDFEGEPIEISSEPLRPHASISSVGSDFLVRLAPDPTVKAIVASFVALTNSGLAPLAATEYCGPKYEKLVPERLFGAEDLATLVSELLPELKRWFVVELGTERLPEVTADERPRVVLDVRQKDEELSVLATLVYGDPPLARVDKNRLVHIEGPVPMRKLDLERRALEHLRQSLNLTVGVRSTYSGKEALQFAAKLDHWHGEIVGRAPERWVQDIALKPRLSRGDLLPRFCARLADGQELVATAASAVRAFRGGLSQVPLLDGGFARLPLDWLTQHVDLLERLLASYSPGEATRSPPHLAPTVVALHEALNVPVPPDLEPVRQLLAGLDTLPVATLPKDLTVELRPYQHQGVNWLHLMQTLRLGAILADDMGLGKTLQVLCCVKARTLVICPTTLVPNWLAEIKRFRPALRVAAYHGKDRTLSPDADVTVTTHALLRLDSELLSSVPWQLVVLDEAQAIKNPDSQVAQAAFALNAECRVAVTGTPVENRLEDLWSIVHFANRGLLGTREQFESQYAEPVRCGRAEAAEQLRRLVRPFLLRRTKQIVLPELPTKTERELYFALDEQERDLYTGLELVARREVLPQLAQGQNIAQALQALLRLRQAACHPSLVPEHSADGSSKILLLLERLQEAIIEGHRSLVFSQWTAFLDLIEPHLRDKGIEFARLDGKTTDRGGVVECFQRDDGPKVLLLSLKAGGTGLNLTAADHVFLMDLWWNPAVEQQAADRAHRIGQQRPVIVHRLVAKDTVEERILMLHAHKRSLFDTALEDTEQAASLTRDELIELLT